MFAIIKTGGKQYRVTRDQIITVEKLAGDAGDAIELDSVLAIGEDNEQRLGTPLIEGAGVVAEIVEQKKGDKVVVFKKKRRQNYRRKRGHRQELTVLRISDIVASGFTKGAAAKKRAAPVAKPAVEKTADDKGTPAAKAAPAKKGAAKGGGKSPAAGKTAKKKTAAKKSAATSTSAKKAAVRKPSAKKKAAPKAKK